MLHPVESELIRTAVTEVLCSGRALYAICRERN
jgi:hypothetical protein